MGSSYKKSCTHALFITRAMTRSEPESDWKLPKEDEDPFHCFFSSSNLTVVGKDGEILRLLIAGRVGSDYLMLSSNSATPRSRKSIPCCGRVGIESRFLFVQNGASCPFHRSTTSEAMGAGVPQREDNERLGDHHPKMGAQQGSIHPMNGT